MIDWRRVRATSNSAALLVRSEFDGRTVTVSCNNSVQSQTTNVAVKDGVLLFEFSGLLPDRAYDALISDGYETAAATVKTMPASFIRMAWISCIEFDRPTGVHQMLNRYGPIHIVQGLGDINYPDGRNTSAGGITSSMYYNVWTEANVYDSLLALWRTDWFTRLSHETVLFDMPDDHQRLDNWDGSLYRANQQAPGGLTYQRAANYTDVTALAARFTDCWKAYNQGMPENTDSDIDGGALYYRYTAGWDYLHNKPLVGVIVPDHVTYKDIAADTPAPYNEVAKLATDNTKTYFGDLQTAWIKASILDYVSRCTHVLLLSSKQPYSGAVLTNIDSWGCSYTWQSDDLLDWLDDHGIWLTVLCGDRHDSSYQVIPGATNAGGIIQITACPIGVQNHEAGQGSGYSNGVKWKSWGPSGDLPANYLNPTTGLYYSHYYGIVDAFPEYIEFKIHHVNEDRVAWKGRRYTGEDSIRYEPARL